MKYQVVIVGAGPAGLVLGLLLDQHGISNIILEKASRRHVEERLRAGVLEPGTTELLVAAGVGQRMQEEALVHDGFEIIFDDKRHRIDLKNLGQGSVTVYGQTEMTKDLIKDRLARGSDIAFNVSDVALRNFENRNPYVTCVKNEKKYRLNCDFIAGCDGFHGVSRETIGVKAMGGKICEYPFAWLGILAEAPPLNHELTYVNHPKGLALFSMRSNSLSRNYLQCRPHTDPKAWSDSKIWKELQFRLGKADIRPVQTGKILNKGIVEMHISIADNMQFNRLFLAGDAAHILPPTGAKGLNLAISDAKNLAGALTAYYKLNQADLIYNYSTTCLTRARAALNFSLEMTGLLHRPLAGNQTIYKSQIAQLNALAASPEQSAVMAKKYLGKSYQH